MITPGRLLPHALVHLCHVHYIHVSASSSTAVCAPALLQAAAPAPSGPTTAEKIMALLKSPHV